jgi:hypothetical protein
LATLHREEDLQGQLDVEFFDKLIPKTAEKWLKVRIVGGGDMVHASDKPTPDGAHRDASFIRVSANSYIRRFLTP